MVFFMPCFFHLYRKQMGLVHALMISDCIIRKRPGQHFFPHHDIVMSWIKKEGNKPCLRAKKWEWYSSQQ